MFLIYAGCWLAGALAAVHEPVNATMSLSMLEIRVLHLILTASALSSLSLIVPRPLYCSRAWLDSRVSDRVQSKYCHAANAELVGCTPGNVRRVKVLQN